MITWIKERGRWVALAALVLVNVVLLSLLFARQASYSAVPAAELPARSGTVGQPSPEDSGTPSATSAPAGAEPTPSAPPAAGPRRLMAANSRRIAWRAEEASCSKRAIVEVTTDGGRTWRKTDPGVRGIVRLVAYGGRSVFAIGAEKGCKPTYAWTTSPSGTWRSNASIVPDAWFRYPLDKARVHAPGGRTFRPCGSDPVVSFAGMGTYRAAALCPDGRIRTIASGREWRTVQTKSDVVAVNADESAFVAARVMDGCDGVVVQTFSASGKGLDDDPRPCHTVPIGEFDRVGVAVSGGNQWVWAAARSKVS